MAATVAAAVLQVLRHLADIGLVVLRQRLQNKGPRKTMAHFRCGGEMLRSRVCACFVLVLATQALPFSPRMFVTPRSARVLMSPATTSTSR